MAGQLFRAEIPGELTGNISYRFVSEDQYGNQGQSAFLNYTATGSCQGGGPTAYCAPALSNSVSANGGVLSHVSGTPGGMMSFAVDDVPTGQFGVLYNGPNQIQLPFGCGERCVAGTVTRSNVYLVSFVPQTLNWDTTGIAASPFNIQFWFRDPNGGTCSGGAFNLTNALGY